MIIRKYKSADRSQVEFIQYETYFLGKPGNIVGADERLFNKSIRYYLEREPKSCFIAEEKGKIVGYLLGCLDDNTHGESIASYLGESIVRLFQLPFMHHKDRKFWFGSIKMIFSTVLGLSEDSKFKTPKDSGHIHINLLPEARGKGVGSKLLRAFFKYAKLKGTKLIHADSFQTRVNPNKNFWMKNGFKEYSNVKTSFWKTYYPNEDIKLVCYVKKL